MFYFKTWKRLTENFHIICIDLLGFGRSSRPKFKCKTSEEAEDFFVLSIEKWREQMQLDSFSICCHSFGGYVMGRYALRFSDNIKKIIFLSSLGVDHVPEDIDQGLENFHCTLRFAKRAVFRLQKYLPRFIQTINPYSPLRVLGRMSGVFLKRETRMNMKKMPEEEFEIIYRYLYQVTLKPASAESAIHVLFTRNFIPKHPLIEAIDAPDGFKARGIDTCFIYGDSDWLDMNMNGPKVSAVLAEEGHNVHVLEDSDHHLFFDNVEGLLKIIEAQFKEE
ncbi:unnamed protein product [Moneuplotes crassus]|uniref:AB hydrolase-1 domain-containing protein n=1 Tax=Euplotes crassus TaxID=5936 RepID=A0AAD1UK72_EUPCR|nr:unnamed protein product [Moneuplotes crassus]